MAIKVIKHGETKFRAICPTCGCEFEYEFEDLVNQYDFIKQVKCPDCGQWLNHKDYTVKPYQPYPFPTYPTWTTQPGIGPDTFPTYPNVIWCSDNTNLDCEKCPNKPAPDKAGVVGDTPCTWCKKNQPYCYTGDKFLEGYKGGIYTVSPDLYKNVSFTNIDYKSPTYTTTYTTDIKDEK